MASSINVPGPAPKTVLRRANPTRIVSSAGRWIVPYVQVKSNGTTQLTATSTLNPTYFADCSDIQIVMANGYPDVNGFFTSTGNPVNFRAVMEIELKLASFSFGGQRSAAISAGSPFNGTVIDPQQVMISDPLPVSVLVPNPNGNYGAGVVRVYHSVASGGFWPCVGGDERGNGLVNVGSTDPVFGGTKTDGSDATVDWATNRPTNYTGNAMGFLPIAYLGRMLNPVPVALLLGNSFVWGYGTTFSGYLQQALNLAGGWGWHNDALNGALMTGNRHYNWISGLLSNYVDVVLMDITANDVYQGYVTDLADYQDCTYRMCARLNTRAPVWLATTTPITTSTDSFKTTANQTKVVNGGDNKRITYNNWLRSAAGQAWLRAKGINLGGIIDTAGALEVNADGTHVTLDADGQQALGSGGYWPCDGVTNFKYTPDGLHPNDLGATTFMIPAVPVAAIRASAGF
jgi:hypothetical protein